MGLTPCRVVFPVLKKTRLSFQEIGTKNSQCCFGSALSSNRKEQVLIKAQLSPINLHNRINVPHFASLVHISCLGHPNASEKTCRNCTSSRLCSAHLVAIKTAMTGLQFGLLFNIYRNFRHVHEYGYASADNYQQHRTNNQKKPERCHLRHTGGSSSKIIEWIPGERV